MRIIRAGEHIQHIPGYGISVRESGGGGANWMPTDLTGLKGWWDFSDATTLFTDAGITPVNADNDAIYQANDKGGAGLHVAQATATARPTYKTGIQNGRAIARLDGGDCLLRSWVLGSALAAATAWTLVAVQKQLGTQVTNTTFSWGPHATERLVAHWSYSNTLYLDSANAVSGQGRISGAQPVGWDDVWHIVVGWRSGTSGLIYVDGGTAVVSGALTTDAAGSLDTALSLTLALFTYWNNAQYDSFAGDCGEILTFNTALSMADLNTLGAYLASKWGLTWTTVS